MAGDIKALLASMRKTPAPAAAAPAEPAPVEAKVETVKAEQAARDRVNPPEAQEAIAASMSAAPAEPEAEPEAKQRGRGRPKGSKGKAAEAEAPSAGSFNGEIVAADASRTATITADEGSIIPVGARVRVTVIA